MTVEEAENKIWDLESAIKILTDIYQNPKSKLQGDKVIFETITEYKRQLSWIKDSFIKGELIDSVDQNTGKIHESYKK